MTLQDLGAKSIVILMLITTVKVIKSFKIHHFIDDDVDLYVSHNFAERQIFDGAYFCPPPPPPPPINFYTINQNRRCSIVSHSHGTLEEENCEHF